MISLITFLRVTCFIFLLHSLHQIYREQKSSSLCMDDSSDGIKIFATIPSPNPNDSGPRDLNVTSAPCCLSPRKECSLSNSVRLRYFNVTSLLEYPVEPLPYKVILKRSPNHSYRDDIWFSLYHFKEPKMSQSVDINISIETAQTETENSGAIHLSSTKPRSVDSEGSLRFLAGRLSITSVKHVDLKSLFISTHENLLLVPNVISGTSSSNGQPQDGFSDYQVLLDQNLVHFPGNQCFTMNNDMPTVKATTMDLPSDIWSQDKWFGRKPVIEPLKSYGSFTAPPQDLTSITFLSFYDLEVDVWVSSPILTLSIATSTISIALLVGYLVFTTLAFSELLHRYYKVYSAGDDESEVEEEYDDSDWSSDDESSDDELDLEDALISHYDDMVTGRFLAGYASDWSSDEELYMEDALISHYDDMFTRVLLAGYSESSSDDTDLAEEILAAADDLLTFDLPHSNDSSSSSDEMGLEEQVFPTFADDQLTFDLSLDDGSSSSNFDIGETMEDIPSNCAQSVNRDQSWDHDSACTELLEVTSPPDERETEDDEDAAEEEGNEKKEEEKKKRGPPDIYYLSRFIPCPPESNTALAQGHNIRFMSLRRLWQRHQMELKGFFITPEMKASPYIDFRPITCPTQPKLPGNRKPTFNKPRHPSQGHEPLHQEPPAFDPVAWRAKVAKRWSFRNKRPCCSLGAFIMSFIPLSRRAHYRQEEEEFVYVPGRAVFNTIFRV